MVEIIEEVAQKEFTRQIQQAWVKIRDQLTDFEKEQEKAFESLKGVSAKYSKVKTRMTGSSE